MACLSSDDDAKFGPSKGCGSPRVVTMCFFVELGCVWLCQRYGPGVPAPPVYMTTARLSAQQPPGTRPVRADAIN
jgi:hypothetical protein